MLALSIVIAMSVCCCSVVACLLGSASSTTALFERGEMSFGRAKSQLVPRPWLFDDLDAFIARILPSNSYAQALVFVDNSGADVVLGMLPFVRELLRSGGCERVALVANERPTINDVTHEELREIVGGVEASWCDKGWIERAVID